MSRVERVDMLLRQIEHETKVAFDEHSELLSQNARLKAENAKLRELCADMYRCSDPCNDCPHYNCSNSGFYCGLGIGWKAKRMRELGIEVDGC